MIRKFYNKLVRDNIIDIILKDNGSPKFEVLGDNDFRLALKEKLLEESKELKEANTKEEIINELSDILEIVHAMAGNYNLSHDDLEKNRVEKKERRGGFDKKIFLEYSDEEQKN